MRGLLLCLIASFVSVSAFAQEPKEITNSIGMRLVLIPKGTFTMGSPENEERHRENELQHDEKIGEDYYLGVYEVTQEQYASVLGSNPSYFQGDRVEGKDSSMHPVERVSWDEAVEFCKRLSELPDEKKARRVYRLPTEVEWEYACRAGSNTAYCFGDDRRDLVHYAWFGINSGSDEIDSQAVLNRLGDHPRQVVETLLSSGWTTHPVGLKKPNTWGLFDMHGTVSEWCSDRFDENPQGALNDSMGLNEDSLRVYRGGCWIAGYGFCRSAFRSGLGASKRNHLMGFRVALSPNGNTD
ncbi:MAG: formylglycine-generating enzyme family protein [Planctomycetota bacterium]